MLASKPSIFELPYSPSSEIYFKRLSDLPQKVWLDSGGLHKSHTNARFDILSAAPIEVMTNPNALALEQRIASLPFTDLSDSLLQTLPFTGGAIGFARYESQHSHFNLPGKRAIAGVWGIFDWALIQDHLEQKCFALFLANWTHEDIQVRLALLNKQKGVEASPHYTTGPFIPESNADDYQQGFDKIQRYLHAGDCYQINFTQHFSAEFSGDAASAYCDLRKALPAPYSVYLELDKHPILSLSPEQFIHVTQQHAQTKPIKGTAPRGKNKQEDLALAEALLQSEKNRAENIMIVDLLRNDFGTSCTPGSVTVPALCELESFANVHHLVSTVSGQLNSHCSPMELFFRCFPGGSITGAPKKRAMEIIEELEQHERSIYCGSVAYRSTNNKMDSSIAIRTLEVSEHQIHCWGGGGIVADSKLEEEYAESIQKVRALMDALSHVQFA